MSVISLSLLKLHVRADDFATDDEYLQHLLDAAEAHVADTVNQTSDALLEQGGGETYPLPIVQAVLLLAGHWYNQREAVASAAMTEVPYTVQALLKPYRVFDTDDDDDEEDDE